jgi:hypothetical protein
MTRWTAKTLPVLTAAVLAAALPAAPLWADIFLLENGGKIEGQWLNRDQRPPTNYIIRRSGTTLVLPLGQVKQAIAELPPQREYARRAAATEDTADAQWQLARWCRQAGLAKERELHLARAIELDPNHAPARAALGFQFLKGQWVTREGYRRDEGYEYYRGKWRMPQEIEILESRSRTELAEKDWLAKLRRWRRELDDRQKAPAARTALAAVKDPLAVGPIDGLFARERARPAKYLYADMLVNISTTAALRVLVERALSDPDEEVFYYCVDRLAALRPPRIGDPFITALKDNSNVRVNRGAIALARLGEKSAVSPLIDALETTHTEIVKPGPLAGADTAGFGSFGTFSKKGNDGPQLNIYHIRNQAVLDALTRLTGANFAFDKKAWRFWYAQERIAQEAGQPVVDGRRQ